MSLLLPKTPGGVAAGKQLRDLQARRAADNIQSSSKYELSSDEWCNPEEIRKQVGKLFEHEQDRRAELGKYHLPKPVGWRIQVLILQPPSTTSGGLELPADVTEQYAHKAVMGVVVGMGPQAYSDEERFGTPPAPWVALGDLIQFKRYDVSQFDLANGQKLGTLNDTQPIGVLSGGWIGEGVDIDG